MVLVEGDATMNQYEDAEGKTRTALSIIQRESPQTLQCLPTKARH